MWNKSHFPSMLASKYENGLAQIRPFKKIAIGGDKGYPAIVVPRESFAVVVTDSATRTPELKAQQKSKVHVSTKLAPVRSVVERTIRRIKLFGRLGSSINHANQQDLLMLAVQFAAGFINESIDLGFLSLKNPTIEEED